MLNRCEVVWRHVAGRPVRSLAAGTARPGTPELVVLPGLGALGYLAPLVLACSGWTRVHLLDLPGFGDRRTARCPAAVDDLAEVVARWVAQAATEPVLLLGHSTGAQVALHAAAGLPRGIEAVVAAGVTFPPELRRWGPLAGAVARTLPHERPGELPAVLPYYVRGARRLPALLRSALADRPEEVVAGPLPRLLVVRGEHDRLCPQEWAAALADRAGGTAVVLPGGHNVPWTHPAALSAAVRSAC